MAENLPEKVDEEILSCLDKMSTMEVGSNEYIKAADGVKSLYQLRLTERKNEMEHAEKCDRLEMEKTQFDEGLLDRRNEEEYQRDKLDEEKKARRWRTVFEFLGVGLALLNILDRRIGLRELINFEREGSLTSKASGNVIGEFFKRH